MAHQLVDDLLGIRGWGGRDKHKLWTGGGAVQASAGQQPGAGRLVPRNRQRTSLHRQQLLCQAAQDGRRRGSAR